MRRRGSNTWSWKKSELHGTELDIRDFHASRPSLNDRPASTAVKSSGPISNPQPALSHLHLTILNTVQEQRRVLPALEEFARQHSLPPRVLQAADLALEEHVTNVIHYGFTDFAPHAIDIRLAIEGQELQIEVSDDGRPFNPLARPPVDTSLPPDERPIGGLGIHLIRSFMDEVDYRRENGRNILRMRKLVPHA